MLDLLPQMVDLAPPRASTPFKLKGEAKKHRFLYGGKSTDKKMWNNAIVCDVWGINVSWKDIRAAVSCRTHIQLKGEKGFTMLPTGFPSNCAVFAIVNLDILEKILAVGHF